MGVSSSESHDLTAFYEMLTASLGVLSQNAGFDPYLDRIVETTLRPLNLGPGGGSYNEPISRLHWNHQAVPEYKVGDRVWLSLQNYSSDHPMKKLDHKWAGPFLITKVISPAAIKLRLSAQEKHVHPIVSVSSICPYIPDKIVE